MRGRQLQAVRRIRSAIEDVNLQPEPRAPDDAQTLHVAEQSFELEPRRELVQCRRECGGKVIAADLAADHRNAGSANLNGRNQDDVELPITIQIFNGEAGILNGKGRKLSDGRCKRDLRGRHAA